uniref:FecR family protein n=1 Tax=Prevotella sp. GTC17262 TaxID=3236797 RepID=A0AB33JN24_9BACT
MDERINQYLEGLLNGQETEQLLLDAQSSAELKAELTHAINVKAMMALHPSLTDEETGKASLLQRQKAQKKATVKRLTRQLLRYAAILILGIVGTAAVFSYYMAHQQPTAYQKLSVPEGQRAQITLPDGTSAWVNSGSTITYPSTFGDERTVSLCGEAYFDVAKDADHPFVVQAGGRRVKALGTQFNVRSYAPGSIDVSLYEGSVRIYEPSKEEQGTVLSPLQQLIIAGNRQKIVAVDQDDILWRDGIISFKSATMQEVAERLHQYYHVDIIIKNADIVNQEYTGKFRLHDGVTSILQLISKVHPFNINHNTEKDEIILY